MNTIKQSIIQYAEEKNTWIFGGILERELGYLTEHKNSNISRRCRELVNEGKLEKRLVQVDGKGPYVVQYRIAPEPVIEVSANLTQLSLI